MRTLHLSVPLLAAASALAQDYVVLAAFADGDPFDAAVTALAAHREASVVRFDPADLEPVRKALTAAMPRHVALVMRPEQIEFGFVRRFLQLATELDDDPFVDVSFGYITGRTAEDAAALVARGIAAKPSRSTPRLARVAGGVDESFHAKRPFALRKQLLRCDDVFVAGEDAFPDEGRDREFIAKWLPKLDGVDAVTFVGHGWPREVAGGPTFADLDGVKLENAVVLNVACFTGVTNTFWQEDWRRGVLERHEVPLDESFCLALLRTGVLGYTAYTCPRPAGPELDTDLVALVAEGLSLGDARRRDYDKTVLGFLGYGEERLALAPPVDGAKVSPASDAVRDIMLEGATGGILFGDPAVVPFVARADETPVGVEVEPAKGDLSVTFTCPARSLYLHCSDPTAKYGKTMAMKAWARVPIGDLLVGDVVVDELRVGRERLPSRVIWAVEEDHGQRFLQVKVNFPRQDRMFGDLKARARIVAVESPQLARRVGGHVERPRPRSSDVRSLEVQPAMVDVAKTRGVPLEAVEAAVAASAVLVGADGASVDALEELEGHGSDGFRAVCVLIEVGHTHYRTWKLLEHTWSPGDERHLIALASIDDLPNYASWTVLRGLGVADTPEVRTLLLERLRTEDNGGEFMSAAAGLAMLGVPQAAELIVARMLEFRGDHSGVVPHLVKALEELGAVEELERYAADPRSDPKHGALVALQRLDAGAAERARKARGGK